MLHDCHWFYLILTKNVHKVMRVCSCTIVRISAFLLTQRCWYACLILALMLHDLSCFFTLAWKRYQYAVLRSTITGQNRLTIFIIYVAETTQKNFLINKKTKDTKRIMRSANHSHWMHKTRLGCSCRRRDGTVQEQEMTVPLPLILISVAPGNNQQWWQDTTHLVKLF